MFGSQWNTCEACEALALLTSPSPYLHKVTTPRSKTQEPSESLRTLRVSVNPAGKLGVTNGGRGQTSKISQNALHGLRTLLGRSSVQTVSQGAEAAVESACAAAASPLPAGACACAALRVRDGGREAEV